MMWQYWLGNTKPKKAFRLILNAFKKLLQNFKKNDWTEFSTAWLTSLALPTLFRCLYVPRKIGSDLPRIKDLCFRCRKLVCPIKLQYYQLNTFSLHGVSCKLGWNVSWMNSFYTRVVNEGWFSIWQFVFSTWECKLSLERSKLQFDINHPYKLSK